MCIADKEQVGRSARGGARRNVVVGAASRGSGGSYGEVPGCCSTRTQRRSLLGRAACCLAAMRPPQTTGSARPLAGSNFLPGCDGIASIAIACWPIRYATMSSSTSPHDEYPPLDLMAPLAARQDVALLELWRSRIREHSRDAYAGIPISKFPEDLRTYERILWEARPQVVVEIGVDRGGSAIWLRDRLFDFQRYRRGPAPRVLAVDVDLAAARANFESLPPEATAGIDLIEGDIKNEAVVAEIHREVPRGVEVLVIEDAAHDADTTLAALQGLAPLVQPGGFYVVEDTCVDIEPLRVDPRWPRGAGTALEQWLASDTLGRCFRRRCDLQPYGLTCHPGGLLQRKLEG
jgi:cephalosporin hydroxylase